MMPPLTTEQVAAVLTVAGLQHDSVSPIVKYEGHWDSRIAVTVGYTVYLQRDGSWAYDDMAKAVTALGTTKINFRWTSESGDYSEVTPGDPSVHAVDIRW